MGLRERLRQRLHGRWVRDRRRQVLARRLAAELPQDASVLDVGCGDARITEAVARARPDLSLRGVEVWRRPDAAMPVDVYDGRTLPFADRSVDVVLFVDVLHHTEDPTVLLREAARVARRAVVVKDHNLEGAFAGPLLRWMDRFGNPAGDVALPCNYWPRQRWHEAFAELGLRVVTWHEKLGLYGPPWDRVFERSLHFLARLERA